MTTALTPARRVAAARTAPGERRARPRGTGGAPCALAAALTAALVGGAASADDTEIFFGQVDRNESGDPNVLFVLDTSARWASRTEATSRAWTA